MGKLAATTCFTTKPYQNGRDRMLGDGDGLFLRIRPHGTRTWVIEYTFEGGRRKVTIGILDKAGAAGESISCWLDNGRLSLTQARAIAGQWKADRRAGRDPVAEWQACLAAKRAAEEAQRQREAQLAAQPTVREAVDQFAAKHLAGKKSAAAMRYRLDRLARVVGERKLGELARRDIITALEKIAEGQTEGRTAKQLAGEVLIQAKRLWRFAVAREWIAESRIETLSRKDVDARPVKRNVALRLDELVVLWRVLGDPERCTADRISVAALRLLILTGQREREVTDAEWTELDLVSGLWRIPAARTKSGRAHLVHLAPQTITILEDLRTITGKNRHVFASPFKEGQPIFGRSVNNALGMMFRRGLLPNVTPCHVHDLRRTLISRLPDLGFEPFIGHKIANHVLPGVLAHYNHNEYLPQREAALRAWADRIEVLATESNVIQLRRPAV